MVRLQRTDRRLFLGVSVRLALAPWRVAIADEMPKIQVFKSPTCGCCKMWVDHLAASGFDVEAEDVADLEPIKQMAGVPDHLMACHTGMIEGYTIEGHIPATAIKKLLAERPAIKGLAVPGMPAGSPGMPSSTP
ncbi:MAG: DUF411 domain-containing protein, partial [Geminicoccaceae bacterium]